MQGGKVSTFPIKMIEVMASSYSGSIQGTDVDGVMDIEFPDLVRAAIFIRNLRLAQIARIRSDGNGITICDFTSRVVIQVDTGGLR